MSLSQKRRFKFAWTTWASSPACSATWPKSYARIMATALQLMQESCTAATSRPLAFRFSCFGGKISWGVGWGSWLLRVTNASTSTSLWRGSTQARWWEEAKGAVHTLIHRLGHLAFCCAMTPLSIRLWRTLKIQVHAISDVSWI